jgi:hypothetical protein
MAGARRKPVPDNLHCCDCGGTTVSGNGNCWWDVVTQHWQAEDVDNFYCSDCQCECQVVWAVTMQVLLFEASLDEVDDADYCRRWQALYYEKEMDDDEWIKRRD